MSRSKLPKKSEVVRPRSVPVVVTLEAAREVILTGDFTEWALDRVRLEKGEGNQWRTELLLPPGEYQYRLRVDGSWRDDPRCPRLVPNAFGTQNNILVVE